MSELLKTPFYQSHLESGGKLVDFSGWNLPINYGSQIKEHEAVRTDAGMFDVSHMLVTDVKGKEAKKWLQYLLTNDVDKLKAKGKALYTPMLNEKGGIIDDFLVTLMDDDETFYRIVSNAGTRAKNLAHYKKTAESYDVTLTERNDLSTLAIQGPNAVAKLLKVKPEWKDVVASLKPFEGKDLGDKWYLSRAGYTGEDGVEVVLPPEHAVKFFNALKDVGVLPCGLGARDTLRLEAGMNLYGHDMDEEHNPLECGLAWTVAWNDARDFIGKSVLVALKEKGVPFKQVGIVLDGKGVLREGMKVVTKAGEGILTSGTFSPTLKQSVGIARVPRDAEKGAEVDIRGTLTEVRIIKMPFVRNGKKQFE